MRYKSEISKLKTEIDEYKKTIETATAAKTKVVTQQKTTREEITKMRS